MIYKNLRNVSTGVPISNGLRMALLSCLPLVRGRLNAMSDPVSNILLGSYLLRNPNIGVIRLFSTYIWYRPTLIAIVKSDQRCPH